MTAVFGAAVDDAVKRAIAEPWTLVRLKARSSAGDSQERDVCSPGIYSVCTHVLNELRGYPATMGEGLLTSRMPPLSVTVAD